MGLLSKLREWAGTSPSTAPSVRQASVHGASPHRASPDGRSHDGRSVTLFGYPTLETFVEKDYLAFNPDIAHAVRAGAFKSGRDHFEQFHDKRTHKVPFPGSSGELARLRGVKAERIAAILKPIHADSRGSDDVFDVLTADIRASFGVIDTDNVSANDYDGETTALIDRLADGLILDCGAGSRPIYYDNVVNYEIVKYPSTDVVGVAEVLPFEDDSFDAVLSYAVLEHVKQPFLAASEISRVLKPGGVLRVIVPFLQPLHGFPSHFFNMTHFGLATLFEDRIEIDQQFVGSHLGPIWTMYTLIRAWHLGLPTNLREPFLDLTLRELLVHPVHMMDKDFVSKLSDKAMFEIASATGLVGHKRAAPPGT